MEEKWSDKTFEEKYKIACLKIAQLQKENEQLKCCGNCDNGINGMGGLLCSKQYSTYKRLSEKCDKWIINSSLAQGE